MEKIVSQNLINTGGGTFDPHEDNIYFLASNTSRLSNAFEYNKYLLIAVNEINSGSDFQALEGWLKNGNKIFLDSGVYNLAMEYAKRNNLSHDEGLNTPPHQIDGFNQLFDKYIEIVKRYGDQLWGYIEIDLGGKDYKIQTRQKLHDLGLNPIPVYHPFGDGWEYFDYLAERYDRICFGNIVQADKYTRKRLLATMWERHKKYPNLWIHLLGVTPNELLNAYPSNSADSSSWLASVRWSPSRRVKTALKSISGIDHRYTYKLGDSNGADKAVSIAGYEFSIDNINWRNHLSTLKELGFKVYAPDT